MLDQPVTVWLRGIERPTGPVIAEGERRRALGHLTYVGWRDVTAAVVDEATLPEIAERLRTESVVDYVSFASAELLAAPPPNPRHQIQHAHMLLSRSTLERTIALLATGARETFLHQEQLLSAAKLAIHHGQPGRSTPKDLEGIGTLLLAVNDCLMDLPRSAPRDGALKAQIRALVARRAGFLTRENPVGLIARYGDLLLRRASAAKQSGRVRVDFDERFTRATGWGILEFMAAATFYTIPFLRSQATQHCNDRDPRVEPDSESVPWSEIGNVLDEADADGYVETLRQQFSLDRVGFAQVLSDSAVDIGHRERIDVFKHPLYRREDGTIVPLNLSVAAENMSIGAFWALHGACAELDPKAGVTDVTSDIGRLFEDYVAELLVRSYGKSCRRGELFREARCQQHDGVVSSNLIGRYVGRQGQAVAPIDALVVEGDAIVLLEVTARTIPLEALVGGVAGCFDRHIERIVQKFQQVGRFAGDVVSERVTIPGVSMGTLREVFPVVVLLHPYPQHYVTWETLEESIASHRCLALECPSLSMQPPQLLTSEELEMLEPHLREGLSLSNLLREKIASAQFRHRSMKDFMLHGKALEQLTNEHIDRLYDDAFDRIRPLLQGHLKTKWDVNEVVRDALVAEPPEVGLPGLKPSGRCTDDDDR